MRTIGILHSGSNAKHFHDSQISGLMNGLLSVGVDSTNTTITTLFAKDHTGKTLRGHADDLATTLAAVAETRVFVAACGTLCAATAMAAIAGRNITVVFTSVRYSESPSVNMTRTCVH